MCGRQGLASPISTLGVEVEGSRTGSAPGTSVLGTVYLEGYEETILNNVLSYIFLCNVL